MRSTRAFSMNKYMITDYVFSTLLQGLAQVQVVPQNRINEAVSIGYYTKIYAMYNMMPKLVMVVHECNSCEK